MTNQSMPIYLMPAIFSDPSGFKGLDWLDGEFNWNGAWTMTAAPLTTASDDQYMSALGTTKGYMPAMSPAFFTVCLLILFFRSLLTSSTTVLTATTRTGSTEATTGS